jgi:hypothetical protein
MTFYEVLIRIDFVLAVALLVVVPLGLLAASVRRPAVRDRLLVYWRASALLGITVYLWAGEDPMGFATGWMARALIPLALWRGDALLVLRGRSLPPGGHWQARAYRWWRRGAIAYNLIGVVYMLPLVGCVFSDVTATCRAWYGPPQQFAAALHPGLAPVWLVRIGWVALGLYAAYLLASTERLRRHREEQGEEEDSAQQP